MSELYNQCNGITFLSCTAPDSALEVALVGCSSEFLDAVLVARLLYRPCLPWELQRSYSSYYFVSGCKNQTSFFFLASSLP